MREGWVETTLGNVLTRRSDRLGKGPEPRILTVTEGAGLVDQLAHWGRRVATDDVSDYKVVDPGDVVYNVYLLWKGAIGQNLFPERGVTSPVYEVFTPEADVESRYLGLLLRSPLLLSAFDSISIGSIQRRRRAPWQDFERISIHLPPLAEQRRIVDLVGAVDDTLAAAKADSDAVIAARSRFLDSLFGGVAKVSVGSLLSGIEGGRSPKAMDVAPRTGQEGVLKVSAVTALGFEPRESKTVVDSSVFSEQHRVRANDVLVTRANTAALVGQVCLVPADHAHLFLCDKTLRLRPAVGVGPSTLVAALNSPAARMQLSAAATGTSASMKNISQENIRDLRVGWPDDPISAGLADQALLARHARSKEAIRRLRELRTNLLTALLSGEHGIPESYDKLMRVSS